LVAISTSDLGEIEELPMRRYGRIYIAALVVLGFGSIIGMVFSFPDNEPLFMAIVNVVFAVLTFPLGAVAWLAQLPLLYHGIATPSEAMALFTPLYAVLGYVQWFRILPAVYRDRSSPTNPSA
jgi:hypothetical protein